MRLMLCIYLGLGSLSSLFAESVEFTINLPGEHDYARQLIIPAGFGEGEFTFEMWILPDAAYPAGTTCCGSDQLLNWSDTDEQPYSSGGWWFAGNFLLDGHNNASFEQGTFSLQFYGGGRVRWLFGDGVIAGPGGHWSVGAYPATTTPSLLDDQWHQISLVRRWIGDFDAQLELWIDGNLIATEISSVRTNMRDWWDNWIGLPSAQAGWFWGAEKQAALGDIPQYEDYKGLIDEIRYWNVAKTPADIAANFAAPVTGTETGLVSRYGFDEGSGNLSCDTLEPTECIDLLLSSPSSWSIIEPPLTANPIPTAFIRGDYSCNGVVGLEDAIQLLSFLFQDGPAACCPAAADANGDLELNIADSISLLVHLFASGEAPPSPYPNCGSTGCAQYSGCP